MDAIKIDAQTIEAIEVIPATTQTTRYKIDFLIQQKKDITAQRDEMIRLKEAELKEVSDLLAQCVRLGVTSKPEELL